MRTQPLTATGAPSQTSTIPYHGCATVDATSDYALALALFCLPLILIWLARVLYLTHVEATVFGVGMNIGCDESIPYHDHYSWV